MKNPSKFKGGNNCDVTRSDLFSISATILKSSEGLPSLSDLHKPHSSVFQVPTLFLGLLLDASCAFKIILEPFASSFSSSELFSVSRNAFQLANWPTQTCRATCAKQCATPYSSEFGFALTWRESWLTPLRGLKIA